MQRFVASASLALLLAACGGGSDDPSAGDGGTDGPSGGADAPRGDGGGTDGGGGGTLTSCEVGPRIDTLGGVSGSTPMRVGVYADRFVTTWQQIASVSKDGQYHAMGRVFDGTAFGPVTDLGIDVYGNANPISVDSAGRAFFQRYSGSPSGERRRIDLTTGTFSAAEPFTTINAGSAPIAIAAYPSGGAVSAYNNGAGITIERWTPAAPTWTAIPLAGTPTTFGEVRVATNDAGQAVVAWLRQTPTSDIEISAAIHDGVSTWSPIATLTFGSGAPRPSAIEIAMLSTGDAVIAFQRGLGIESTLVHSAGTIDPPTPIVADGLAAAGFEFVVDGWDRQTLLTYEGAGTPHTFVRRNVTGTWGEARDLGTASSTHIVEDLVDGHVAIFTYQAPTLSLRRTTDPAGDVFTAAVPVPIGVSSTMTTPYQTAALFSPGGGATITVVAIDQLEPSGIGLGTATCH